MQRRIAPLCACMHDILQLKMIIVCAFIYFCNNESVNSWWKTKDLIET